MRVLLPILLVLCAFSTGCVATLVEMPQDTRATELTEVHFRNAEAVRGSGFSSGAGPVLQGTKQISYWEDPLSELEHGSMTFEASASDFVAAKPAGPDDLMHLKLRVLRRFRRHSEQVPLWVTTPWANISEIRQRVKYRNDTAPLMIFAGIPLCTIGAMFAFVFPRDVNPSAATTDRLIGGTFLLTGAITSVVGAVYALKHDDVTTLWPPPSQP